MPVKAKSKTTSTPPRLDSFRVKPALATVAPAPAMQPKLAAAPPEGGGDWKLTTLRFTLAQRRHLRQIAFNEQMTLQDRIVAAIDARLASKRLPTLENVKA